MAKVALSVAEDEIREELARVLKKLGHDVAPSSSLKDGLESLGREKPQVLVVEEGLDGDSGEALVRESLRVAPLLPVIVCLKRRDAPRAVEFLKMGAFECVAPPWTSEALAVPIRRALRLAGTSFDLTRPVRPDTARLLRRALLFCTAVAVAGLAAVAVRFQRQAALRAEEPLSAPLPYAHPTGLAAREGRLWVGDWYTQSIYVHEAPGLAIDRVQAIPGEPTVALAFVEGNLWVLGPQGKVAKRLPDAKLAVLGRLQLPVSPVGLVYDGLYLWTLDAAGRKLRKHLLDENMTVLAAYAYPGKKPASLAYDGSSLWSLDEDGRLFRHDIDHPDQVLESFSVAELKGPWRPTGLTWDGKHLWAVAESRGGESGRIWRLKLR